MVVEDLFEYLRRLEVSLHDPDVRADVQRLEELLHQSFTEFGRSGRRSSRAQVLEALPKEQESGKIWAQDFSLAEIADGVALLTYRTADVESGGALARHALRSSLWERTGRTWRLRFHQGTPSEPFPRTDRQRE